MLDCDWSSDVCSSDLLGSVVTQYQTLISDEVKADTRKLASFEAFQQGISGDILVSETRGPRREISLKNFANQRREYLLNYRETKAGELQTGKR
jgi:hypothetical protein